MPVNGVPRPRECASLVVAGLRRRAAAARSDKTGAVYAFALTLECAATITLTATGINLTIELWSSPPYQVSELQNLAFRIGSYQHHLLDLAAYLVLLGLLASLLGLAATRAWGRVGTPESDAVKQRLNSPDYREVAESLHEIGIHSATDLLATYAGQKSDLGPWYAGAELNRDGDLRLQYLAGWGINSSLEDFIYRQMLKAIAGRR